MKTQITKVSENGENLIQIYQSSSYAKNGRKGWDRQAVYLDEKMVKKIVKLCLLEVILVK